MATAQPQQAQQQPQQAAQQPAQQRTAHRQVLTFTLGAEEYAFDILRVQEIRGASAITPLPNTPPHIKGVMNLRGSVVPVISLRERFGMPPAETSQFAVTIVLNVGTRVMGVIVDALSDVLDLPTDSIEGPPQLGAEVDTSFLIGMAKSGDKLIALLDVERTLGTTDPV